MYDMNDYDTEDTSPYDDAFRPKGRKRKVYTNDPGKAEAPLTEALTFLQAHIELIAAALSFFALILTNGIAAADVATGGYFSQLIPGLQGIWGICSVIGIDLILVGTLAAAAWAGRQRKFGKMTLWFLASAPSATLMLVQLLAYAMEQVGHMTEVQALGVMGLSPLSYAIARGVAALFLTGVAPWIAKETWFRIRQLPVVKVNQTDTYVERGGNVTQFGAKAPKSQPMKGKRPQARMRRNTGKNESKESQMRSAWNSGNRSISALMSATGSSKSTAAGYRKKFRAEEGIV